MQLTIATVFPQPRPWGEKYPDNCSVRFVFSDGTTGEYATKKDKAEEHIKALSALIGKPSDFEVKEEKERDGIIERRISSYPGKPQGSFGGGGKGNWTPAWSQTEAGERYLHERMDRRTALMQAVSALPEDARLDPVNVCALAQKFYVWLRASDTPKQEERVNPPSTVQNASPGHVEAENDTLTLLPVGRINNSGAQCQTCFAPDGKPHAKGCTA